MNITAILGAIALVPESIRDAFLDLLERFTEDESTGIFEHIGMAAIKGVRVLTNTEDLPDNVEFKNVVAEVLIEAANTDNQHVGDFKKILGEIVERDDNYLKAEDVPNRLIDKK